MEQRLMLTNAIRPAHIDTDSRHVQLLLYRHQLTTDERGLSFALTARDMRSSDHKTDRETNQAVVRLEKFPRLMHYFHENVSKLSVGKPYDDFDIDQRRRRLTRNIPGT